ncbi:histone methylation protein DOT1-domain-containing protein [Mycena leptocephala]|nr:histone methylation protein DOT1-domain-containing protein [Mycena leptocephala]
MPPTKRSKDARCPAPTSGAVRKELKGSKEELACAPFTELANRLNFIELLYHFHARPRISFVTGQSGSRTYGELGSALLTKMDLDTLLSPGKLFLDIGAGIGKPAMHAALSSGCDTISYEIGGAPAKIAVPLFRNLFAKCAVEKYSLGRHQFVHADVRENDSGLGKAIASASVILINNKAFDVALILWIEEQLKQFARTNTHIFVTSHLGSLRRRITAPNVRQIDDISLSLMRCPDIRGDVLWSSKETILHHYVFHRPETLRSTIVGNPIGPPGFHAVGCDGQPGSPEWQPRIHHTKHPVWL